VGFASKADGSPQEEQEETMTQIIDCPPSSARTNAAPKGLDLEAVKARQRAMWATGDFAIIGTTLQIVGETLCEAVNVASGSRVLDVACGNGNATLAAARRFCRTIGLDYVPELLARGRERAAAERLPIEFIEGDAENLPFPSATFDAVLSTFGVMFTPHQARAAEELLRVCVPGGRIGLASWTPEGFLGDYFKTVAQHVPPPPAGMPSPFTWGTEKGIESLFGPRVRVVSSTRKMYNFRYESGAHFIEIFRTYYGPTRQAFNSCDDQGKVALETSLARLLAAHDRGGTGGLVVPAEYLEIVLEKR
jgi:ubiquinone/menaquinone biosynthesis C-methylase UbiE